MKYAQVNEAVYLITNKDAEIITKVLRGLVRFDDTYLAQEKHYKQDTFIEDWDSDSTKVEVFIQGKYKGKPCFIHINSEL